MNRFYRECSVSEYTIWLTDGSYFLISARNTREAIQLACKKYFLTEKDIDIVEKSENSNNKNG